MVPSGMTSLRRVPLTTFLVLAASFLQFAGSQECEDEELEVHDGLFLLQTDLNLARRNVGKMKPAAAEPSPFDSWTFYQWTLIPLLAVALLTAWFTRPTLEFPSELNDAFRSHRLKYLLVWGFAVSADWLQGPYVYALYDSFGYSSSEINKLFVAGFGSSMIFGTFVGSLADTWGRKRSALLYCVMYIISCVTKHCGIYSVLMVGRITGGIATSLLFSCFECWMVGEHKERHQFSEALLRYMFSMMYFVSFLVAIISGIVAQLFVDAVPMRRFHGSDNWHYGGNIVPFDMSIAMLCIAFPLICILWDENYGDREAKQTCLEAGINAVKTVASSWKVSIVGLVVACFEGSMYAFVINWTPALSMDGAPSPPHGLIFSAMMMCCMMGSSLFSFLNPRTPPAKVLFILCFLSSVCFIAVAFRCGQAAFASSIFYSFLCFEALVGLYMPAMGALKSDSVPEEARAGVYNIYRVPLNLVVCAVILTNLSLKTAFSICAVLLAAGTVMMMCLLHANESGSKASKTYQAAEALND